MAQVGIEGGEHCAVVLGELLFELLVLCVGLHVGTYDTQDGLLLVQVALHHKGVEPGPVFGRRVDVVDACRQVVLLHHVVLERGGTSLGQPFVVLIRTFGRCIAVDAD